MPRKEGHKVIQAEINPEQYEIFKAIAAQKGWSDKRLNEKIVRYFIKEARTTPEILSRL